MAGVLWLFKLDNIKLWINPCQTRGGKVTSGVRKTGKKTPLGCITNIFSWVPVKGAE